MKSLFQRIFNMKLQVSVQVNEYYSTTVIEYYSTVQY